MTLYTPTFGEHYHSTHGAVQESRHIYTGLALRGRLERWDRSSGRVLEVLEVGFGTGLNALMTALLAEELHQPIRYTTLEKYPIGEDVYSRLSYDLSTETQGDTLLRQLHCSPWGEDVVLSPNFTLHKVHTDLTTYIPSEGDRRHLLRCLLARGSARAMGRSPLPAPIRCRTSWGNAHHLLR